MIILSSDNRYMKYNCLFSNEVRALWSWPYGSWIFNYICNQCLSPLMLWVRIPLMTRHTLY